MESECLEKPQVEEPSQQVPTEAGISDSSKESSRDSTKDSSNNSTKDLSNDSSKDSSKSSTKDSSDSSNDLSRSSTKDSTTTSVNEEEHLNLPTNIPLQTIKLPVSLVFKRTCYKCGSLGHFANECTSNERLCYNCKTPGHESSVCPNDRNSESKQCYFCREVGHIQSECPKYQQVSKDQPKRTRHHNDPYHHLLQSPQFPQPYMPMNNTPIQSAYHTDGMVYQPWVYQQPYQMFYSPHPGSPQEIHEPNGYFNPQYPGQEPYFYLYEALPLGYLQFDSKQAYHHYPHHTPQNGHYYQHKPPHHQHQSDQYANLIQLRGLGNALERVNSAKQQRNCYECGRNGHEVSF